MTRNGVEPESASAEFRRRLLAGERVSISDFTERRSVSRATLHTVVSRLRQAGVGVGLEDGVYWLPESDASAVVPAQEVEERRRSRRTPVADKEPAVDYPALGSTLRVVRLEAVGRRVLVTFSDGVREWSGPVAGRRVEGPEAPRRRNPGATRGNTRRPSG